MTVDITETVPAWMEPALTANPDAEVQVSFLADPDTFYRALKLTAGGIEYAGNHGMPCWQPVTDAVAFRIGADGDIAWAAVAEPEPEPAAKSAVATKHKKK